MIVVGWYLVDFRRTNFGVSQFKFLYGLDFVIGSSFLTGFDDDYYYWYLMASSGIHRCCNLVLWYSDRPPQFLFLDDNVDDDDIMSRVWLTRIYWCWSIMKFSSLTIEKQILKNFFYQINNFNYIFLQNNSSKKIFSCLIDFKVKIFDI